MHIHTLQWCKIILNITVKDLHNRGHSLCKWSPWDKHSDWSFFLLLCLNDVSKSWDAIDGHMSWLWGRREGALKQNAVKAARFRQRVKYWSAQRPHIRWIKIILYYEWVELEESEIDCYFSILTDHSKQFLLERIHTHHFFRLLHLSSFLYSIFLLGVLYTTCHLPNHTSTFSHRSFHPTFTHIHTSMNASEVSYIFSILPNDTLESRLGSNHQPSD